MKLTDIRFIVLAFMILFLPVVAQAVAESAAGEKQTVFMIPISGTVEPGMAAYVKRALAGITDDNGIILFKMDTFGGRVDAALEIVDTISNTARGRTIAYVEKRAISAGALIALSASQLFMKDNTIIGDCAPIITTQEGQEMAGEKVQTVLRARFRALAKRNNYPPVLAESMVTIDMEVYRIETDGQVIYLDKNDFDDLTDEEKKKITAKKTIVAKGELLTMDDREASELGFSQLSVSNVDQVLKHIGLESYEIVTIEESWSESLVRFLQPMLPILMLIGVGALYTEIKAPGFGLPGLVGIFCLALVFFNQYLVGLADITEILLLMIGGLLIGVEVFVLPGFGVAGISGIIVIAAGLVLAFQGFVIPDPSFPWEGRLLLNNLAMVIGLFLGAFLVSMAVIRYVLPQLSRIMKGPYLMATLKDSHVEAPVGVDVEPGDKGIVHTFLRPSGKIIINNQKLDAITQGEYIEKGKRIFVERVEANKVIVKPDDTG